MTKIPDSVKYSNPDGSATWEYISAFSCSSMIFCIGCVLGWTSPSLAILMGPNSPMAFTDSDASITIGLFSVGWGLSSILSAVVADRFGRKNSLLVVSIPMMVNWGLIVVAKDVSVLFLARFLAGLCTGLTLALAPMYLGEIASVKLRGALGMIIGVMTNTGVLGTFLVAPYLSLSTTASICLSVSAVSMIGLWFVPESPYLLAMIGKMDEAESALEKIRGRADVTEEMDLIKRTIDQKMKEGERERESPKKINAFKQLISVPGNRRALFIIFLFIVALQCGSYSIMMVYGHILFQAMNAGISSSTCATLLAALQLVFNILTVFVIDKFGRKPLVCISGIISGACVLTIGVYFYLTEFTDVDVTRYSVIPVGAMFVNISALSIGLMPLQMVIQCEILSTEVKALASCLCGMSSSIMTAGVTGIYLKLVMTLGLGHSVPFIGFGVVTWTITALILKLLPETKGKTFLEIQRELNE